MFAIKAEARDPGIKLETLRKPGNIPAVFYGMGKESASLSVPVIQFKKVWREAGESSAVKIDTPTGTMDVLIHDVQVDPVSDEPIHVDFLAIDMKKKITVKVPLIFEGISSAVRTGAGNLVKVLHEVEIEALPADLPHNLIVDITPLAEVLNQIFVSDIRLPAGVAVVTPQTDVVASIVAQVEEKEEAPVDLSAIEVEKKGKKEEEGAGEAESSSKEEKAS